MDLKEYQEMWQDMAGKQDLFMYAVVAMEASRGIGLDLQLPWPFLRLVTWRACMQPENYFTIVM